MDDRALHGHLIGRQGSRGSLNTPVLVLDRDALDRNIARMASAMAAREVAMRPHAKTHKSVAIARRQIAAGAIGISVAKLGEAEVLAEGGITGLLITSPVAAPMAIERLARLAVRAPTTIATVDDPQVAAAIDAALAEADTPLDIVIDVDPGMHRTGVASPAAAAALAEAIARLPRLRYRGVQFYCGAHQHIADFAERRDSVAERTAYLRTVIAALTAEGFAPEIVTGSGTGTHLIDAELGVLTECQAGSYLFMDQQYLACDLAGDGADNPPYETALAVDARVVSANHAERVTIDAGYKALATDGGMTVVQDGPAAGANFAFMGDEHASLSAPGIAKALRPGDAVRLTVPHCDPTVNLYDSYHVVRSGTLVEIWPIEARGRGR